VTAELPTPTGREMEILKVLWDRGPSSVRDVHAEMSNPDAEQTAFNTVQTLLRIMEVKQLVAHHAEGRTFIYTPLFSREESAARFLDRVFDGAASELMLSLLRAERVPAVELDRMHDLIAAARCGRRLGGSR
jgi:BlaI family transcriptional regulator, penicillinase repressor